MKPTIIIVDDLQEIREEYEEILKNDFQILAKLADGPSAVKAIRNYGPDMVVIDVVMPGMSGIEVIKQIIAGTPPHPKFVVVSGVKEEKVVLDALSSGAQDYLYKPVSNKMLIETLLRKLT